VVGWREEEVFQDQFSRRVLSLLARRRMFVADLAKESRIPYPTLYGYLRQGRRVPVYAAARMASSLGVSLSELAGEVVPGSRGGEAL
jgi:predicted transcriptional regulator